MDEGIDGGGGVAVLTAKPQQFLAVNPLTGAPINSEQEAIAAAREADAYVGAELGKAYRQLDEVRERLRVLQAELPAAALPKPRYRSDVQAKVARCPRCGEGLA